jgi:hypothetical protein
MIVESPRGSIRAKARVTDAIAPGVVCCQHGWWQDCKDLKLSGYDAHGKHRRIQACSSGRTSPIQSAAHCHIGPISAACGRRGELITPCEAPCTLTPG